MPLYFDPGALPEPMSLITFSRRDEAGEMHALQHFTLLRVTPHRTIGGEASAILQWQSACMACGERYAFTAGLDTGSFYRRCKKCRRGKQPAGWPKGPRMRHTLTPAEPDIDPASLF